MDTKVAAGMAGRTYAIWLGLDETQMALFRRDPTKKLKKVYNQKMDAAMHAMRRGDVRQNAMLVAEADKIQVEIDLVENPR